MLTVLFICDSVHLQEKLEQRRQAEQQQAMMQQPQGAAQATPPVSSAEGILTDADLDKLKVDVLAEGQMPRPQQGPPMAPHPPMAAPPQMGPRWVSLESICELVHLIAVCAFSLQHMPPAEGWPKGSPKDAMGPQGIPGPGFPRGPTTPQMSPRTPSPFMSPSPGMVPGSAAATAGLYPRIPSPGMQSPPMAPPQKPPMPTFRGKRPRLMAA